MDIENISGYSLRGLKQYNILVGKNGCGKSYLLKRVEENFHNIDNHGQVRYLSPERGGTLKYAAGVDENIGSNPNWLGDRRRRNQAADFRQQSATLFRRLELLFLRKMEEEHTLEAYVPQHFGSIIDQLNSLLDRVQLARHNQLGFEILDRLTGNPANPEEISSGESELISLGIEFLSFAREADPDRTNILLVDEPDVHLHPDLQERLARFIIAVFSGTPVTLIVATHSTPLLSALSKSDSAAVSFLRRTDREVSFRPITEVLQNILPVFGAHPLSEIFNQAPILLVEGEDDERIWQQAVRSSKGTIRVHPCAVGSIDELARYETEVNLLIQSIYDDATGYSLRDRDVAPELIDDVGSVVRMRLSCRAAENLMLADDVLASLGTDWTAFKDLVTDWVANNGNHQYFVHVSGFLEDGFDRKSYDLKKIRNILIGLVSNKPWEVLVGQSIANLATNGGMTGDGTLKDFLGKKACMVLIGTT